MAMRPIWSGALSFGLINIPVRLYSGTQEHAINFDMLHKTDLSPIRFAKMCKEEGQEVPYKDIVKGYEYQKGEYVVVTEEDFEKVNVKKTKTIEIHLFTYEREIDSIFFEKPYFLEPDKGAAKAYALLKEALERSEKVAVVTFVLRNREHLGLVKPYKNGIILNQLRYASEIRDISGLELPDTAKLSAKELDMAVKLIDELTQAFNPEAYHDTYVEELRKMIEEKAQGKKPKKRGEEPAVTPVKDLMAKLKASLEKHRSSERHVSSGVRRPRRSSKKQHG